jgi:MFS family permease
MLELPRELPGALIVIVISALAFLGDVKLFSLGALTAAIGAAGLGIISPNFMMLVVWMIINNLGLHMMLPLTPVIGMSLSENENYGMRLGRYAAYNLSATIIGYAVVWVGFKFLNFSYKFAFVLAAIFYLLGAIMVLRIEIKKSAVK